MDAQKLAGIATHYEHTLDDMGIVPERSETGVPLYPHLMWMCQQIPVFIKDGREDKAHRWLGFIQGVLFTEEIFDLSQLKDHNRDPSSGVEPGDSPEPFVL